jgi:hypothetical protein
MVFFKALATTTAKVRLPPMAAPFRLSRLTGLFLLTCFFTLPLAAQIGIQGQYHLPGLIGETESLPRPALESAWSAGLVYTFRQSGIRWEWIPGLFYLQTVGNTQEQDLKGTGLMAGLDTRVYPMDLYGDCLCPTFSRKGALFQKGFFWEGGAGAWYLAQDTGTEAESAASFFLRVGAGLDIGLSRRFTITPGVRLQYMQGLHHWGENGSERQHKPIWILPFLQWMTYLGN